MSQFAESHVEDAALEWLSGLSYAVLHGPDISPDGPTPERVSYDQVLLTTRLRKALARFNSHLPVETLEEVLRKVQQTETPSLIEEICRLYRYLIEGVPVEVACKDGSIGGDVARLIDFDDVDANDWLTVNQFTVIEQGNNRRPDVVLFVNSLPLVVIELKNPGDENVSPRRSPRSRIQGVSRAARPGSARRCASKYIHFEEIMLGIIFGRWQCQRVFDNRYVEILQSADNAIVPGCSGIY